MQAKRLLVFLAILASAAAGAKAAPWYWWASKIDGARVCQQTSPGSGWIRVGGPYPNGRCNDFPSR